MSTTKVNGLWRGERKCIDPEAGDAELWIKIGEELQVLMTRRNLGGSGACQDEGFMAESRAKTVQQEREEVYAALQYAASFHCLVEEWKDCEELKPKPEEKWIFVDSKREETKHRTDLCAEANQYRCMKCG